MLVNSITGLNLDAVLTRILPAGIVADANVATGTCVLVATADWGPENVAVAAGNFNEWVAKFGSYRKAAVGNDETSGYVQAMGYFKGGKKKRIAGGGADLRTIRVCGDSKAKAASLVVDHAAAPVGTLTALYYGQAGDGIKRTIVDGDARLEALTAAPAVATAASGGSLPAATYLVKLTVANERGETLGSPAASQATSGASSTLSVTLPALPAGADGFHVYLSADNGVSYHRVNVGAPVTGASYVISAEPTDGAVLPSVNSAATSFHLIVSPFDGSPDEVFKNLTPASAANAINGVSKYVIWQAGASNQMPAAGVAFLAGGDSGLDAMEADYIGEAGSHPSGFELAATISDANFLISGKLSPAIKAQMRAIAAQLFAQAIYGPDSASVSLDDIQAELRALDDWAVIYPAVYERLLNPVSGIEQDVCPAGSIAGALSNAPYWVNLSQCQLLGYIKPSRALSENDANMLAGLGGIPITEGNVLRKGSNTSKNAAINQIEDFRIPVFLAKALDKTIKPMIAEPQVYDPTSGTSPFFEDLREGCEQLLRTQPKEAVQAAYVDAHYDADLAEQNKARIAIVVRQTPKANQIIVDLTADRTALRVVPANVNLISGS